MAGAGIGEDRRRLPWLLSAVLHFLLLWLVAFYGWRESAEIPAPIRVRLVQLPPSPGPVPAPAKTALPSSAAEMPPLAPPPSESSLAPPSPSAPTLESAAGPQAPPLPQQAVTALPPPAPEAAPPRAAVPRVSPRMQEIARDGFAGTETAPLTRSAPLTAEQWQKLGHAFHLGAADSGIYVEAGRAPRRAAASKRAPPLTKEQWAAFDKIHHVGAGNSGAYVEAMRGPLRAAASKRSAPLTAEQWAALDKAYFVGAPDSGSSLVASEAGRRGALSVRAAFTAPAQEVQYGYGGAGLRQAVSNDIAARAVAQPLPEIPMELAPTGGTLVAVARFAVAADGTAKVDLTGPTPEPRLNQMLLAALQKWRFTPAYQGGSAVASTLEVRLTIAGR